MQLFKCTASVAIWGNSKWKQKTREEQAESDGTDECEKVAILLGLNLDDLLKGLLKPKIKVCLNKYHKIFLKKSYLLKQN